MEKEKYYSEGVEFQASFTLETHRLPDPYCYIFKNGKLHSPVTNAPVENSITINSPLDKIEASVFQKIQKRLGENKEGMVVWISPPHPERSAVTKVIFSDIVYDYGSEKYLRNRAVCLGLTFLDLMTLAHRLGFSGGTSAEELRASPIFLDPKTSTEFIDILAEYGQRPAQMIKDGKDFILKEKFKAAIAAGYAVPLGPFPGSCGPSPNSAFNTMFGNSLNISEASFACPKCHRAIPSGHGITTCPHCGAKKSDFGSGCD